MVYIFVAKSSLPKYPIKLLSIRIIHDNCWSSYYLGDAMVRIVGLLPQAERNTLKIFAVTGERGYKNISELKDKGVIKTIQGISRTGGAFVVEFTREYTGSVTSILTTYNAIILDSSKINGEEHWRVLAYEHMIPSIIKGMREIGEVRHVSAIDYMPNARLTSQEYRSLLYALEMGYFDYPRRVKAKEIASALGIRESTFVYHIRNAQRKMLSDLVKSNFSSNSVGA